MSQHLGFWSHFWSLIETQSAERFYKLIVLPGSRKNQELAVGGGGGGERKLHYFSEASGASYLKLVDTTKEDVLSRLFQTSCQMMQLDPAFDDDNGDDDEREAMVMGARRSFHPRITAVRFFSLLRNSRRGPTVALRRIPKNN